MSLLTYFTMPGVLVHQWSKIMCCKLTGAAVHEVCWFQLDSPAGYVVHDDPESPWQQFVIGLAPIFLNTLVAMGVAALAVPFHRPEGQPSVPFLMLVWVAVAVGAGGFPSLSDAESMWELAWSPEASVLSRLVSVPVVGGVYLGAFLRYFWADVAYGGAVVVLTFLLMGVPFK